jgi:peptidoglycan/xylan/chitin deacetylase (PgdA/CDA1 family)
MKKYLRLAVIAFAAAFLSTVDTYSSKNVPVAALPSDTLFAIRTPDRRAQTAAAVPEVIFHGPRTAKLIALTFDACSTKDRARYDSALVNILVEKHVPATLFLGGKWMEERPAETRYLSSLPMMELANHTYSHPHLTRITDDSIRWQLLETNKIVTALTGKNFHLFRAPFGELDARVVRVAAACGLRAVQYDLASGDPDKSFTRDRLAGYVIRAAQNGSIVVMHINGHGWHTAEALPVIIDALRARGFSFVTVSKLLSQI